MVERTQTSTCSTAPKKSSFLNLIFDCFLFPLWSAVALVLTGANAECAVLPLLASIVIPIGTLASFDIGIHTAGAVGSPKGLLAPKGKGKTAGDEMSVTRQSSAVAMTSNVFVRKTSRFHYSLIHSFHQFPHSTATTARTAKVPSVS